MKKKSIVLLGIKHCGKTTQGKKLAEYFKIPFFDTDFLIEKKFCMSCRELYKTKGAEIFMKAEEDVCREISNQYKNDSLILATGGGICDNAPALNELRCFDKFIFMNLDLEFSINRIMSKIIQNQDGTFFGIPAYISVKNPKTSEEIHDLLLEKYQERFEFYKKIADITVDLKNAGKEENFKTLLNAIEQK